MEGSCVVVIPAKDPVRGRGDAGRLRVAAYARVSTELDEQQNSYQTQVHYYEGLINGNPDWEFAGIYTDEGISGTSTKKREGFKRMVADALAGRIDLILTKSISRFARNTVDSLVTIRQLKDKGVEVIFEKENLRTMDPHGELLLTIMSSLAQEESRSISQNTTWGARKRMEEGKVSFAYSRFLGYRKGDDGKLYIIEEEAATVRRIFDEFLGGATPYAIAKGLMADGVPTATGRARWSDLTVRNILRNVKYKGDAILQTSYCADFLTKKRKPNRGELPQFYVAGNHPAIIPEAQFERAQTELLRRKDKGPSSSVPPFFGKVVCGDCGLPFGPRIWRSGQHAPALIWRCNHKYRDKTPCATPSAKESAIIDCFLAVLRDLWLRRAELRARHRSLLDPPDGPPAEEGQIARLDRRLRALRGSLQGSAEARTVENYNKLVLERRALAKQAADRAARRDATLRLLDLLDRMEAPPLSFDPALWRMAVEVMEIRRDGTAAFTFRDGTQVTVPFSTGVRKTAPLRRKQGARPGSVREEGS